MMRNQLSHFLQQERTRHGWSQENLAEELEVTRVTIARWESGTTMPSPFLRRKICEFFHVQIEDLFSAETGGNSPLTHKFLQISQETWKEAEEVTQQIKVEKSRIELQEKRLEIQKNFIEYTINIVNKMIIDVLDPQCDVKVRSYVIEELLSNHQYTDEMNSQEYLLPTIGDVRKALEVAKRYMENGRESYNTVLEYPQHTHLSKVIEGEYSQDTYGASNLQYLPPPIESARDIIRRQEIMVEADEWGRCDHVIRQLTHRQFEVLQAFANGLHPSDIAAFLSISAPTVSTHTTVLLALCREAWVIKTKERLDYRFIHLKFGKHLRQ